ncbi:TIGR01212 family radical SAM protein [Persicirhabdus sediminis]|uniref:TIGR01212 family radical SAM protein n=1 Tax=Persicirhabdus sediminis TaxID=454144 RepID=A0A8J7MER2_9BACT|nr:TIGR01212 family radical SAM protein [Persicirhabdus sediminis]MBK1791158.1 TIGR01212 family radical SAM protein [Persicirhabdus sediminis]
MSSQPSTDDTATREFPWGNARRFYSHADAMKAQFGGRVQKVSIMADFTCPNRDGSLGYGGCTFCNNESFTPSYTKKYPQITDQIDHGLEFLKRRYPRVAKYVAYFQAYTNTYGELEKLKSTYAEALAHPDIDGLVIGTRPDCVNDELLDYFEELAKEKLLVVEYGVESCHNSTLQLVHRGHSFEDSVAAIEKSAGRGFHVGAHFMFGLPGESRWEMLQQVDKINQLPIDSVKFHQLQIVKGSIMAHQYEADPDAFELFEKDEYINFIIQVLERLRPDLEVQRLSSESPPTIRIAPDWGNARIHEIMLEIEAEMEKRDTYQGRLYQA